MKVWPLLALIPAISFGFYFGTQSGGSKRSIKTFVDMRFPADSDSEYITNLSKNLSEEDIGIDNFLFNASLDQSESSWGIRSKSFYIDLDDRFVEVCDYLNTSNGYVKYNLIAEGVANSGESVEIDVSTNCNGFDFVELFPFDFCSSEFDSFKEGDFETDASNYSFVNFSDFMPKIWFLKKVSFYYEAKDSSEELKEESVVYNPSNPIVFSCFEN